MATNKQKFYITTAIPYTSAKPHVGNVYEAVLTDAIARQKRLAGYDVFFLTGTDEHGIKIEQKAKAAGVTPKQYVDNISGVIRDLWDKFEISYDKFIRTTDEEHIKVIQQIFKKLYEQGDIYKSSYEGNYCTPCESFWTDTQLIDGCCPDCGAKVTRASEEAYFFRLSKYADKLIEYYESNPDFFIPESRKNEMVNNFIKPGLQDLCVSRTSFTWGVPVDFDPKHVVYVWMDALPNYISALGYDTENPSELYKKYWPADLHVIGKDVVRFHTIYWPIFLLALGEPLPKTVLGHPWLLMNNDKMSKSKGNLLYGDDLIELFGLDAIRYYLLAELGLQNDGNISYDAIITRTNTELANIFGNLVSRTASMIKQYFGGNVPSVKERGELSIALEKAIAEEAKAALALMKKYAYADATEHIMAVFKLCNKYIDDTAPWVLARDMQTNGDALATVMADLVEGIRSGIVLLTPFIPDSVKKVVDCFGYTNVGYDDLGAFVYNAEGNCLGETPLLFKRIDKNAFDKMIKEREAEAERKAEEGKISIDDFGKVSLVVGQITECEPVPKSDKLYKLSVDIGTEKRQVASGIAKHYTCEQLVGKKVVLVENLKSAVLRGVKSSGMILASDDGNGGVKVLFVDDSVPIGSKVR